MVLFSIFQLEEKRNKTKEMNDRLTYLQQQMMQGNETLAERTTRQDAELAVKRSEVALHKQEVAALAQNLDSQMKQVHLLRDEYNTIQEEANEKSKKLKKLWERFQQTKSEISSTQRDAEQKQLQILAIHDELRRELRRLDVLVTTLVPAADRERVAARIVWDESALEYKPSVTVVANNVMSVWKSRPDSAYDYARPISYNTVVQLSGGASQLRHSNLAPLSVIYPPVTVIGDQPPDQSRLARPPSRNGRRPN